MESSTAVGPAGLSLTSADRLRIYRKCFHDLDEHLAQLHQEGLGPSDAEFVALQAEIRCLEELIMLFTDITSILPSIAPKSVTGDGFDPSLPSVDGLNLSLVTDILMLSATSPWTVFVAERSQWQICYVSPSVKRAFGWKASELLGVPAWDGCHTEDIPTLQRMLLLKECATTGTSLVYRRLRKDRSYATVQATGRAVGTRWYAWVEQDIINNNALNGTPQALDVLSDLPLSLPASKSSTKTRSADSEGGPSIRSRKLSSTQRPTLEAEGNTRGWNSTARPASPLASLPGLERQTRPSKSRGNGENAEAHSASQHSLEPDNMADENQVMLKSQGMNLPISSHLSFSGSETQPVEKLRKGKAVHDEGGASKPKVPGTPSQVAASSRPASAQQINEEVDLLWGKKILLVEDDRVNRTIAQRLLENLKCNVKVACNGKEALDILQEGAPVKAEDIEEGKEIPPQFDLVLMDLLMPVMDGTKAVQYFRDWEAEQEPPRKRMVIFALTSNVSDGDMVKCAISGFDEFVSKPLTIDKLVDRLQPKH
ncbi:probable histidine kinase 1 isoform X1 [Selaginella moellendorffii]|uniref:probable histidine kinase 1 isoform X1 n=1 Tax=Selaginella moellendorffii TaxID=88036 RepID=UPI000D1CA937|nr:probable histidine kinase 1 isoform X1 [Selaginella moellendorffii]|eukprot:XP_024525639.1 probable histidine kinase 1 isoform X1 [Selaginella moellendorffii]